jgi:hypothetical protein
MGDNQLMAEHASCDSASLRFAIRRTCRHILFQVLFEGWAPGLVLKVKKLISLNSSQVKGLSDVGIRGLNLAYQVPLDLEMTALSEDNIMALHACRSNPSQRVLILFADVFDFLQRVCELFRVDLVGGIDPIFVSV